MRRCFGKRRNITRVASVFLTESVDYRKRESNYRKHHSKFPYVYSLFGLVSLDAANLNDKEGSNSPPSSLTSQSLSPSPSHREKRSANGYFTKPGAKGTPKTLEHMRRGYQNYIVKRKLEFGNCIDENEPPSKREKGALRYGCFRILYSLHRGAITGTIHFLCYITGCHQKRRSYSPRNLIH